MIVSIFMSEKFTLIKCHRSIDQSIDIFSLIFYRDIKRLMATKNLVVEFKNLVVNYDPLSRTLGLV